MRFFQIVVIEIKTSNSIKRAIYNGKNEFTDEATEAGTGATVDAVTESDVIP